MFLMMGGECGQGSVFEWARKNIAGKGKLMVQATETCDYDAIFR